MLELAHRLDRETSGLLIVAKKRSSLTVLHDMMRDGAMEKRYLTLVPGKWINAQQHDKAPLYKYLTAEGERRVRVSPDGKPAHSIVRLIKRWKRFSLLEVELKTGRTHQIRVHMKHIGHTLFNDERYGGNVILKGSTSAYYKLFVKNCFFACPRQALHAKTLGFVHPTTKEYLHFESDLPDDMQELIDMWRAYGKEYLGL